DIMIQEGKVREEISQKHHQKCYLLTGPKYVNGKKLADTINEVEKYGNVTYRSVSRHELEKYLCSLNEDDCGCDYDRIDYILAQRDAAYFIQDGLALLRRAIAEFLRGSQRSGKSNYNQGINRLNSAVRLLGELVYQYNQQDNRFDQNGQNRNQYLREARNQRLDQQYL
ncbi:1077_t:CDS:1, partial [Acaulospora morrowiae]